MIDDYKKLLEQLKEVRKLEEEILDKMDFVWKSLTEKEINTISNTMHRLYIKVIHDNMNYGEQSLFFVFDVDQQSDIFPQINNCIEKAKQLTLRDAILCDSSTFYCGTVNISKGC